MFQQNITFNLNLKWYSNGLRIAFGICTLSSGQSGTGLSAPETFCTNSLTSCMYEKKRIRLPVQQNSVMHKHIQLNNQHKQTSVGYMHYKHVLQVWWIHDDAK